MGEFDSPSTHSYLHPHQPFTIGSEVEVTINEEGFRGALFRATILKLRTSIFPSKKKRAVVEYETLVTEDGSNPLKEQVDVLSLRPIPPDIPDIAFEECDIVDAVDKDGWWTGVVCKILENGGYSVFFKNPMHVMEFQRNQLRLHQDWIDSKWVVPKKMGASILKDQLATICTDANIPDNVQSRSIYDKKYASFALASTKRRRSLSSKSRVSYPVKKFRGGKVPGAPIAVRLKKTENTLSSGKSLNKNSISKRGRRIFRKFQCDSDSNLSVKFRSPTGGMKSRTKKDVNGSEELKEQGAIFIDGNGENTFERSHCTQTADKVGKEDCDVLETTPMEVSTNKESERDKHLASEEKQMTTRANNSILLPHEVRGEEENSNNKTKEKAMEPEQQQSTENSSRKTRGRPRKFIQGMKKDVDGHDESIEQGAQFINGNRGNTFERNHCTRTTDKDGKEDCDVLETTPKEVSINNESERNKQLASEEKQMTTPANNSTHLPDEVRGGEENSNNKTKAKAMEPGQQQATENYSKRIRGRPRRFMQEDAEEELHQQPASKNSNKRKRGRPRKLMIVPTTAEGKEQDGHGWKPDNKTTKSCVTDLNRNLNELPAFKTNDIGTKSASNNIDEDDRPLLMWLGGMQGPASKNSFKVRQTFRSCAKRKATNKSEQVDGANEVRTVDGTPGHVLDKNQGWPFVKSSPFWRAIDELEVFKVIPQTPHFHPLSTHNKDFREGLAIGYMINFSNLVEDISKLRFDTSRQIFETALASLSELEEYGFNVSMLCNRVKELLCIKDTQIRYLEESKEAENKILEHTENKTKLADESKILEQKIKDLQKRQSSIKLEMETEDLEITRLQSYVETVRECIEDTKQHFEKQATLSL